MSKRYTDELAAWVQKRAKSRPRQDKGLVAFIAVKDDIAQAMEAGYALKTIWEHLHETGKIPCRYETFLKHVKNQIRKARAPKPPPLGKTGAQEGADDKGRSSNVVANGPKKLTAPIREFEVNPEAKKEDLI